MTTQEKKKKIVQSPYEHYAFCRRCYAWIPRNELWKDLYCPWCRGRVRMSAKRKKDDRWVNAIRVDDE